MIQIQERLWDVRVGGGLLLIESEGRNTKQELASYLEENKTEIEQKLVKHGAILFRNFDIKSAQDFEDIAHQIDPELKNNYLGTSPRNSITKYTFSASELPNFYPIPQHCEMSFLRYPPRKLFFFSQLAPNRHGETPICDFRKVYQQLGVGLRNQFREKGVKTIRNYEGPNAKTKLDLWKLKRWDEMFQTTDKSVVEASCKTNEIEFEWLPNDKLRLINRQPAIANHPVTGEDVWFNHTQVFHKYAAAIEYKHIRKRQNTLSSSFFSGLTSFLTATKGITQNNSDLGTHTLFGDDAEIRRDMVEHIMEVIWNNMQFFSWQNGDILAIDNFSTSHGRMPYTGPREIYVCWAANR